MGGDEKMRGEETLKGRGKFRGVCVCVRVRETKRIPAGWYRVCLQLERRQTHTESIHTKSKLRCTCETIRGKEGMVAGFPCPSGEEGVGHFNGPCAFVRPKSTGVSILFLILAISA